MNKTVSFYHSSLTPQTSVFVRKTPARPPIINVIGYSGWRDGASTACLINGINWTLKFSPQRLVSKRIYDETKSKGPVLIAVPRSFGLQKGV